MEEDKEKDKHEEADILSMLEKIKDITQLRAISDVRLVSTLSICIDKFGMKITNQAVDIGLTNFARDYLQTRARIDSYSNFRKSLPGICNNLREKENYPDRAYVTMLVNWKTKEFNACKDYAKTKMMEYVRKLEETGVPQEEIIEIIQQKIEPIIKQQSVWETVSNEVQKLIKLQA